MGHWGSLLQSQDSKSPTEPRTPAVLPTSFRDGLGASGISKDQGPWYWRGSRVYVEDLLDLDTLHIKSCRPKPLQALPYLVCCPRMRMARNEELMQSAKLER